MKYDAGDYEVAVIGAGHAGCEAALACARKGHKTLLFSITLENIANCLKVEYYLLIKNDHRKSLPKRVNLKK